MERLNGPTLVVVAGLDGAGNEGLGLFVKEVLHEGCLTMHLPHEII